MAGRIGTESLRETVTFIATALPRKWRWLMLVLLSLSSSAFAQNWTNLEQLRWDKAVIRKEKVHYVQAICDQIKRNQARYESVERATGVPWRVIASLHSLECDLDFRQNLANGDSLMARTRHVPKNRPIGGSPPFQWSYAAIDSLLYDAMERKNWGCIPSTLLNAELYNGPFYLRHDLVSPYICSWTTLYKKGKIIADGKYSPTAISEQCGVIPIFKCLLKIVDETN